MDSSGFLALVNRQDEHHDAARRVWEGRILAEQWRTYTSNFVIAETHNLFLVRLGHRHAMTFLQEMEHSAITILRVSPADEQRARQIIYQYRDKTFSLTDATSFVVMERARIAAALTTDRHFAQYGLQSLGMKRERE